MKIEKIKYSELNSRQKENYNFAKASSVLAEFGFTCIRLSDDYRGADFIAIHINGDLILKVQLKSRISFDKKYENKGLHIIFQDKKTDIWYLYDHDEILEKLSSIKETDSWIEKGIYHSPTLPVHIEDMLMKLNTDSRET